MSVKICKVADVKTPSYAHPGDAGLDLFAADECVLKPLERKLVSTGVKIALPPGYEAQVRPRSGLALNHGISIVNTPGTIDSGYRGVVGVIAINLGNVDFKVEKNMKIAQMVINKVEDASIVEVKNLDETTRGSNGFGSTGLH